MSGVAGAFPVLTPVEDTSPGPATVSKETAQSTTQAVLEILPRPWTVITLTKVVFRGSISLTEGTCRYSDHCIQRGTDLPSSYPADILTTRNPRQSPSVAHSDRDRSLWRSLSRHLRKLPEARGERSWLATILLCTHPVQNGSLRLGLSQWGSTDGRLLQR